MKLEEFDAIIGKFDEIVEKINKKYPAWKAKRTVFRGGIRLFPKTKEFRSPTMCVYFDYWDRLNIRTSENKIDSNLPMNHEYTKEGLKIAAEIEAEMSKIHEEYSKENSY